MHASMHASMHAYMYIYIYVFVYKDTHIHWQQNKTLHCIALHDTTFDCITWHDITLHYIIIYNHIPMYIYTRLWIYVHKYINRYDLFGVKNRHRLDRTTRYEPPHFFTLLETLKTVIPWILNHVGNFWMVLTHTHIIHIPVQFQITRSPVNFQGLIHSIFSRRCTRRARATFRPPIPRRGGRWNQTFEVANRLIFRNQTYRIYKTILTSRQLELSVYTNQS